MASRESPGGLLIHRMWHHSLSCLRARRSWRETSGNSEAVVSQAVVTGRSGPYPKTFQFLSCRTPCRPSNTRLQTLRSSTLWPGPDLWLRSSI